MRARTLPARAGWGWVTRGFALFRRNPMALTFLVFGYLILLVVLNLVPYVGNAVASIALVPLSMGIMNGCRLMDRGAIPPIGTVFSGFEQNPRTLVLLGVIYLGATVAVFAIMDAIDGGALTRALGAGRLPPQEVLQDNSMLLAGAAGTALATPLMMGYWCAPMLAAWHGTDAGRSLFFSLVGMWRNWRALMVFGLGIFGLSFVIPAILLFAAGLLGIDPRLAATVVTFPLLFVLLPTMFAAVYVSYLDVFVSDAAAE